MAQPIPTTSITSPQLRRQSATPLRGGSGLNCTQGYGRYACGGHNDWLHRQSFYQLAPFAGSGNYYNLNYMQRAISLVHSPSFQGVTEANINGGKFWYNALEMIYDHRTSFGLTLHAGYGYSKAMSATGFADTINRIPARSISPTDAPHRWTVSGVYQLPVGQGARVCFRRYRAIWDYAVGGWQVGAIFLWQSGFPQSMSGWIIDPDANGGDLLPKKRFWGGNSNPWYPGLQAAGSNSYVQRIKPCVATTDPNTGEIIWAGQSQALVSAGLCSTPNFIKVGSYGVTPNITYSGIREGIRNNFDINITKNFKIEKGAVFQMKLDAFNAFNHMQLSGNGFDTSTTDGFFGIYQLGTSGMDRPAAEPFKSMDASPGSPNGTDAFAGQDLFNEVLPCECHFY